MKNKNECQCGSQDYLFDDKLHEECGVFGLYSSPEDNLEVSSLAYLGLFGLQHRGQESAGIAVNDSGKIKVHKGMGLVGDVFSESDIKNLNCGNISVGHVRYSTAGESTLANAQPLWGSFKLGEVALAHNGTLVNSDIIREMFEDLGFTFETTSDSEIFIKLIARSSKKGIREALRDMVKTVKGSYALALTFGDMLIGIRDPNGIRPLCLGRIGNSYILSSESCVFGTIGAEFVRDIEPGEIVIISPEGIESIFMSEKTFSQLCAFEFVYFARPDSYMDGVSVHLARQRAGKFLFEENPVEADVIIGVPDSGIDAAMGYSFASGVPYDIGFIKNRYVGRSFIMPSQKLREQAVHIKLNALSSAVKGKRVILIDDSIVRGTTSKQIIQMLRSAGATEVHLRISSPVVAYPCYFGIDTPSRNQLIGARMSVDEICEEIDADSLAFLSMDGLVKSIDPNRRFCLGCLNGEYPLPIMDSSEPIKECVSIKSH